MQSDFTRLRQVKISELNVNHFSLGFLPHLFYTEENNLSNKE